jgi:ABC-type phosphate transport system substrate-binding protein
MSISKQSLVRLLAVLALVAGAVRLARAADVVIIANQSVKAAEVSADDIRDVFLGEKSTLADGSRVTPVTLKSGAVHEAFLARYIKKDDAAFRAVWRKQVFTGKGSMPRTMESEDALIAYVAATPGAIAYIAAGKAHGGAKTLHVK